MATIRWKFMFPSSSWVAESLDPVAYYFNNYLLQFRFRESIRALNHAQFVADHLDFNIGSHRTSYTTQRLSASDARRFPSFFFQSQKREFVEEIDPFKAPDIRYSFSETM